MQAHFGGASIFYMLLYCMLNTANGCALLCEAGGSLSRKQKVRVAFVSALTLSVLLMIANFVLLGRPELFDDGMPLLSIFSGAGSVIMTLVVALGCLTTLFSLVYSSSVCCRGLCKNDFINFLVSIALPCLISLWGFGNLVAFLYPFASILGGGLLAWLFFIPPLKRAYNKIHSCRKNTKNENAGHDNIKF